jgi:hypothetical protein
VGLITDVVGAILCLLTLFAQFVAEGCVIVANLFIVGIAASAAALLAVLPAMPTFPTRSPTWVWLNWMLPVSSLVALIGTALALMVAWFGYRVVLNWVRAL